MKKSILVIICFILLSGVVNAQDSIKKRINEYYVSLAGITPLNVQLKYKRQVSKKMFFKAGFINLSYRMQKDQPEKQSGYETENLGYSGGLEMGLEFRKNMGKRITFFHGPNLFASYYNSEIKIKDPALTPDKQKSSTTFYRTGWSYTLGFLFKVNENFLVGAEINPSFYQEESENKTGLNPNSNFKSTVYNFTFGNQLGIVSLVFRP